MALVLNNKEKVTLSVLEKGAAKINGVPIWSVTDASVLTFVPAPDGKSVVASSTDKSGTSFVQVSGSLDVLGGNRAFSASLDVAVAAVEDVTLSITVGTPELK